MTLVSLVIALVLLVVAEVTGAGSASGGDAVSVVVQAPTGEALTLQFLQDGSEVVRVVTRGSWEGVVAAKGAGKLELRVEGYWAPPCLLSAAQPCAYRLRPASRLAGTVALPADEARPSRARVRIVGEGMSSEHDCVLSGLTYECEVRAAMGARVRLSFTGFAPVYFPDLRLPAHERVSLPEAELVPGSSISGWIESEVPLDQADLSVEASPFTGGWTSDPSSRAEVALMATEGRISSEGFFQVVGLAAGIYTLKVDGAGLAPSESEPITVAAGAEFEIERPIVLEKPFEWEIVLDPPVAPDGLGWVVALREVDGSVLRTKSQGEADLAGSWRAHGLRPGEYALEVLDRDGSSWHFERIELTRASDFLPITMPLVEVEGEITDADGPLETGFAMIAAGGQPEISFSSNAKGEFHGYLPKEGEWYVELRGDRGTCPACGADSGQVIDQSLDIRARRDGKPTFVRIDVPNTRVAGRVFRRGEPVSGAVINVFRFSRRDRPGSPGRDAFTFTADDGTFELQGMAAGEIVLYAADGSDESGPLALRVVEDQPLVGIEIELESKSRLSARVLASAGEPASGVLAFGDPELESGVPAFAATARSAFDGTLELLFAPGTRRANLLLASPGVVKITSVALTAEEVPTFVLHDGGGTLVLRGAYDAPAFSRVYLSNGVGTIPLSGALSALRGSYNLALLEGGMAIRGLEPGSYALCLRDGECASGTLPVSGTLELSLEEIGVHEEP